MTRPEKAACTKNPDTTRCFGRAHLTALLCSLAEMDRVDGLRPLVYCYMVSARHRQGREKQSMFSQAQQLEDRVRLYQQGKRRKEERAKRMVTTHNRPAFSKPGISKLRGGKKQRGIGREVGGTVWAGNTQPALVLSVCG